MARRATPQAGKPPLRVVPRKTSGSSANPAKPKDEGSNAADLETFHIHVGEIRRAQATVLAARKVLKDKRRAASDSGINLGHLDLVMKMSEEEPETVQNSVKNIVTYASWMGLAPGFQADLFDKPVTIDQETKAENEGYREGLEGVTAAGERYDPTTIPGQARLRGHARGQAVLHDRLISRSKQADPPPPAPEEQPQSDEAQGEGAPEGTTVQ